MAITETPVTLPAEAVRLALAATGGGKAIVHGDSLYVTLPMVHSAIRFTAALTGAYLADQASRHLDRYVLDEAAAEIGALLARSWNTYDERLSEGKELTWDTPVPTPLVVHLHGVTVPGAPQEPITART